MTDIREGIEPGDDYPIHDSVPNVSPEAAPTSGGPVRPPPNEARKKLVGCILKNIREADGLLEPDFKRMKNDLEFVYEGRDKTTWADGNYVANITGRHVRQKTNMLYAKNPRVRARKADRVWYRIWDGNTETAKSAMTLLGGAIAGQAPPPDLQNVLMQAQELISDISQGMQAQAMLDRIGRTLEILFHYFINISDPTFKLQTKQLVRRTTGCGIGYAKVGFQRMMGKAPMLVNRLADSTMQLAHLERMLSEQMDPDYRGMVEEEVEEIRLIIQAMSQEKEIVLREGLVFDFPAAWDIIPIGPIKLMKGFVGAEAVAERMMMSKETVKEIYGVDLKTGAYRGYSRMGAETTPGATDNAEYCCVFEYYDKKDKLLYTVCDGYEDFLEEPRSPTISITQFFPYFVLSWNDVEHPKKIFPPSDVHMMKPMQNEHNRQREALRQHRIANQPNYVADGGAVEFSTEKKIMDLVAHEIMKVAALPAGKKVDDVIAQIKKAALDPMLYDSAQVYQDYLLTLGNQQADLGNTAGNTATESTIAENARGVSTSADVDELDDFLTSIAKASSQIMLAELSPESVAKIAGEAASWPQLSAEEVAEQLYLEIEAGSSGKRHQATDQQNWLQFLPLALQLPGLNPVWLAQETVKRMDERVDLAEAILGGLPAIMVLNRQQQVANDQAVNPPDAQGAEGASNTPKPPGVRPTPQGTLPRPGEAVPGEQGLKGRLRSV